MERGNCPWPESMGAGSFWRRWQRNTSELESGTEGPPGRVHACTGLASVKRSSGIPAVHWVHAVCLELAPLFISPPENPERQLYHPHLRRKLRLREPEWLAEKCQCWDLHPAPSGFPSPALTHTFSRGSRVTSVRLRSPFSEREAEQRVLSVWGCLFQGCARVVPSVIILCRSLGSSPQGCASGNSECVLAWVTVVTMTVHSQLPSWKVMKSL